MPHKCPVVEILPGDMLPLTPIQSTDAIMGCVTTQVCGLREHLLAREREINITSQQRWAARQEKLRKLMAAAKYG